MPTKLSLWRAFRAAVGTRGSNNSGKTTAPAEVTADKVMTLSGVSRTNQDGKTAPTGATKAAETSAGKKKPSSLPKTPTIHNNHVDREHKNGANKITIKASKATSKARIPIAEMAKEINLAADEIRTAIFVMRHREERNRRIICCEIAQTPPGGGRLARRSSKRQAGRMGT